MIIVRLSGGLGNQMFEYAAGRSVALNNNTELKLDIGFFDLNLKPRRAYSLNVFKIQENFASKEELAKLKVNEDSPIRKYFPKLSTKLGLNQKPSHIRETNLGAGPPDISDNSYLDGYWQSEKYFKQIEKIIRNDFCFKERPHGLNTKILQTITNTNSVSIHIRRTDYLIPRSRRIYHICPKAYYLKAASLISSRVKNPHFYVFSDDPDWGEKNLRLKFPTSFVTHNPIDRGYEDLRLMSACKHNIIVNSSFSWWGAWLNNSKDKIIISPKQWFLNSPERINNLIPSSWYKI